MRPLFILQASLILALITISPVLAEEISGEQANTVETEDTEKKPTFSQLVSNLITKKFDEKNEIIKSIQAS